MRAAGVQRGALSAHQAALDFACDVAAKRVFVRNKMRARSPARA